MPQPPSPVVSSPSKCRLYLYDIVDREDSILLLGVNEHSQFVCVSVQDVTFPWYIVPAEESMVASTQARTTWERNVSLYLSRQGMRKTNQASTTSTPSREEWFVYHKKAYLFPAMAASKLPPDVVPSVVDQYNERAAARFLGNGTALPITMALVRFDRESVAAVGYRKMRQAEILNCFIAPTAAPPCADIFALLPLFDSLAEQFLVEKRMHRGMWLDVSLTSSKGREAGGGRNSCQSTVLSGLSCNARYEDIVLSADQGPPPSFRTMSLSYCINHRPDITLEALARVQDDETKSRILLPRSSSPSSSTPEREHSPVRRTPSVSQIKKQQQTLLKSPISLLLNKGHPSREMEMAVVECAVSFVSYATSEYVSTMLSWDPRYQEDTSEHKQNVADDVGDEVTRMTHHVFRSEYEMLCHFTTDLVQYDPDVLLGLQCFGDEFVFLVERMKKLKVPQVERLARLGPKALATAVKDSGMQSHTAGRMIFDLDVLARSLVATNEMHPMNHFSMHSIACHPFVDLASPDEVAREESDAVYARIQAPASHSEWTWKHGSERKWFSLCSEFHQRQLVPLLQWEHQVMHRAYAKLDMMELQLEVSKQAGCLLTLVLRGAVSQTHNFTLMHQLTGAGYIVPIRIVNEFAVESLDYVIKQWTAYHELQRGAAKPTNILPPPPGFLVGNRASSGCPPTPTLRRQGLALPTSVLSDDLLPEDSRDSDMTVAIAATPRSTSSARASPMSRGASPAIPQFPNNAIHSPSPVNAAATASASTCVSTAPTPAIAVPSFMVVARKRRGGASFNTSTDPTTIKYRGKYAYKPEPLMECETFTARIDFVSCFPSQCVEYNLCLTNQSLWTTRSVLKLTHPEEPDQDIAKPLLSSIQRRLLQEEQSNSAAGDTHALIPQQILTWQAQRKVAKLEGRETSQLAFKLQLNTLYGFMGFPNSRFYNPPLASLITLLSRNSLVFARQLLRNNFDRDINFADTDCIGFDTRLMTRPAALEMVQKLVDGINKSFPFIQAEIASLSSSLVIFNATSYAQLEVNDKGMTQAVRKNIQTDHSNSCLIAKQAGEHVVNELLSAFHSSVSLAAEKPNKSTLSKKAKVKIEAVASATVVPQRIKIPNEFPSFMSRLLTDLIRQMHEAVLQGAWDFFVIHQHVEKHPFAPDAPDCPARFAAQQMVSLGAPFHKNMSIPYVMLLNPFNPLQPFACHAALLRIIPGFVMPDLVWYFEKQLAKPISSLISVISTLPVVSVSPSQSPPPPATIQRLSSVASPSPSPLPGSLAESGVKRTESALPLHHSRNPSSGGTVASTMMPPPPPQRSVTGNSTNAFVPSTPTSLRASPSSVGGGSQMSHAETILAQIQKHIVTVRDSVAGWQKHQADVEVNRVAGPDAHLPPLTAFSVNGATVTPLALPSTEPRRRPNPTKLGSGAVGQSTNGYADLNNRSAPPGSSVLALAGTKRSRMESLMNGSTTPKTGGHSILSPPPVLASTSTFAFQPPSSSNSAATFHVPTPLRQPPRVKVEPIGGS